MANFLLALLLTLLVSLFFGGLMAINVMRREPGVRLENDDAR